MNTTHENDALDNDATPLPVTPFRRAVRKALSFVIRVLPAPRSTERI